MVRAEGLEPPRLSPLVPKTSASTNSATPAFHFDTTHIWTANLNNFASNSNSKSTGCKTGLPHQPLGEMGRVTGIEPATSSATNWRSNQLSYTRHRNHTLNSLLYRASKPKCPETVREHSPSPRRLQAVLDQLYSNFPKAFMDCLSGLISRWRTSRFKRTAGSCHNSAIRGHNFASCKKYRLTATCAPCGGRCIFIFLPHC